MMSIIKKFETYLLTEKRYSEHTVLAYTKDVQAFSSFIYPKKFAEVVQKDVRKWIVELSLQEISNRTINRKIAALKSFFKFLYIVKEIKDYPLELISNLKTDKKVIITPSEKEVERIIEELSKENTFEDVRNRLIFLFFYVLGIRKTELINLREVDVQSNKIKVLGKGNKERQIPISQKLRDEIKSYRLLKSESEVFSEYFFVLKNSKKTNQTFVYRLINKYLSGGTVKGNTSPHTLRHSFATHMLNNEANINHIKTLMGHSSLQSTQVYVQNNIEELKKVYAKSHPKSKKFNP